MWKICSRDQTQAVLEALPAYLSGLNRIILIRIQGNTPDPIEASQGGHTLRIVLQQRESHHELIL